METPVDPRPNTGLSSIPTRSNSIPASTWKRQEDDWLLVAYNEAALVATQGRLARFKGTTAQAFYHNRPDIRADMDRCFAQQAAFKREMLYGFRSTGEERHLTMRYVPVPPDLVLLLAEDVTDDVWAEEALQAAREAAETARIEEGVRRHEAERRRQIAESLRDILAALNSDQPLNTVLDLIAAQARHLLGTQAVGIYRLESDADRWAVEAARGLLVTYVAGSNVPIGQEALRRAIVTHRPVIGHHAHSAAGQETGATQHDEGQSHSHLRFGWYQAWLAVPIVTKGRVYGGMLLYYTEARALSEEEIQLATAFCDQAALAIENGRLRQRVEQAAAAAERDRLARDLHDAVTQTLFSASVIAEAMPRIWLTNPEESQRGIEELRQLTRGALAEMRTLLLELRPAALTEKPLGELLGHLADAVTGQARIPVRLEVEGERELPADLQVVLYRIAQEALNNVTKHARASQASIALRCTPARVALEVADDGRGFDPDRALPDRLGLGIMRERAESVGALFEIESQPGQGTRVHVWWQDATRE
jgi:signal transduction histidine kinase